MAVDQLPGRVREFVGYLDGLLTRLDPGGGWCAVFWQRDPDGMRACVEGREVPPWDVVEALLQDLAGQYGHAAAAREKDRVRALHAAALAAFDARPGGRDALGDRLDVMLREQRYAAERQAELGHRLASAATRQEADAIRLDLAWARDDHERATARCAELRSRMAELDRHAYDSGFPRESGSYDSGADAPRMRPGWYAPEAPAVRSPVSDDADFPGAARQPAGPVRLVPEPDAPVPSAEQSPAPPQSAPEQPSPKQRKRRRGSARFAGLAEEEAAPVVVPSAAAPDLPTPAADTGRGPRGARFAGVAEEAQPPPQPEPEPLDPAGPREVAGAVQTLVRLRAEGRTGEAHALLVDAAYWPAARFPLLAAELQRAGLGADWATLLWEAASLPADRLVAAADALFAAGRGEDGEQMLRQGVARPAAEIGQAVLHLDAEGRRREVHALLDAYVRVRTPEEAARSVEPGPGILLPLLLEAAQGVSKERHWDLVHALRVAGFAA
jgi:hypothetical protein